MLMSVLMYNFFNSYNATTTTTVIDSTISKQSLSIESRLCKYLGLCVNKYFFSLLVFCVMILHIKLQ
jgi:hypothetical protein